MPRDRPDEEVVETGGGFEEFSSPAPLQLAVQALDQIFERLSPNRDGLDGEAVLVQDPDHQAPRESPVLDHRGTGGQLTLQQGRIAGGWSCSPGSLASRYFSG